MTQRFLSACADQRLVDIWGCGSWEVHKPCVVVLIAPLLFLLGSVDLEYRYPPGTVLQRQSRLVPAVPDELPAGVLPFHREGHRVPPGGRGWICPRQEHLTWTILCAAAGPRIGEQGVRAGERRRGGDAELAQEGHLLKIGGAAGWDPGLLTPNLQLFGSDSRGPRRHNCEAQRGEGSPAAVHPKVTEPGSPRCGICTLT
ncbi:uncharacterized protein [Globicephala melas]|uniref:uncharacterized protein isoform X2 n=1 Tax=Globicephala melas TaxID=9731 RepID=UPI00293D5AD2|nr:uncharacterized protein LOC132597841 isoform X2 [Globicephala melas]